MVFLVTAPDGQPIWTRPLALSPGWYVLGVGVAFYAGLMYWSYRRQPRPGDPIRPFESIPSIILMALPRPIAVIITRVMFYPTLYWNRFWRSIIPRKQRWWDRIDSNIILGALPSPSHVPELYKEGVRAVVNTCDEYDGPQADYRQYGIEQLWIPTIDYCPPTMEDIERGCDFMRRAAQNGHVIYGMPNCAVLLTALQGWPWTERYDCHLLFDPLCGPDRRTGTASDAVQASSPVVLEYERRYLSQNSFSVGAA